MIPRLTIYRVICERLAAIDRITDASECFRRMVDELAEQTNAHDERAEWILGERSCTLYGRSRLYDPCVLDFKRRCLLKLEGLGDAAMSAEQHDDAISQYSAALSLDPATPQHFFIKRSKAYIAMGWWEAALNDANTVRPFDSRRLILIERSSLGDHARPILPMGLRDEACGLTQGRRL